MDYKFSVSWSFKGQHKSFTVVVELDLVLETTICRHYFDSCRKNSNHEVQKQNVDDEKMSNDNCCINVFIFGSNIAISSKSKIKGGDQCLKWCSISINILVLVKGLKHLCRKENIHYHNKEKLHHIPKHGKQGNEHL